jgi:outer membrane lipoprotein carrier protein
MRINRPFYGRIAQRVAALLAALLGSTAVLANDALLQFEQFALTFRAANGQFTQYTVGPQGQTTVAQKGEFAFERPGRFRWDIQAPHAQLVVSDGRQVYQYDPDLSQATVRSVDASLGSSPAAILFGEAGLSQSFDVSPLPDRDGMAWFRAIPKQPDAGLSQLDIGMHEGKPAELLLLDGFGQTTKVVLRNIRAQSSLPAQTFRFAAPAGTDVITVQ